jgi:hypothetical protein
MRTALLTQSQGKGVASAPSIASGDLEACRDGCGVHGRREVVESQMQLFPGADPVRGGGVVPDACRVDEDDSQVEERLRARVSQRQ